MTEAPSDRAPISTRTRWFAVGALLLAGGAFAVLAFGGLGKNLVYYWGPTELKAAGAKAHGATIRLGGKVVPGSVRLDPGGTSVDFEVGDGVATVAVHSRGVPPQMFRENIGVVVEGTLPPGSDRFESSRLMVSHSNEYRAPKPGEKMDVEAMIRTAQDGGEIR